MVSPEEGAGTATKVIIRIMMVLAAGFAVITLIDLIIYMICDFVNALDDPATPYKEGYAFGDILYPAVKNGIAIIPFVLWHLIWVVALALDWTIGWAFRWPFPQAPAPRLYNPPSIPLLDTAIATVTLVRVRSFFNPKEQLSKLYICEEL